MTSALRASRDFVAHALAAARAGVSRGERNAGIEGPDIKVEPFDAHNVTTEAALIKLGASIGAARRQRANFEANQQDAELAREGARARIAEIRAQAKYYEGTGRQSGGGATLTRKVGPYEAGTPLTDVNADLSNRRVEQSAASEADRNRRIGRVAAAKAGIGDVEAKIERDTALRARNAMDTAEPVFDAVRKAGDKANAGDLLQLGIDPQAWALPYNEGGPTSAQRLTMLDNARKTLMDKYSAKHRRSITRFYEPERKRYQSIIDQGVEGFGDEAQAAPAAQGDQGDPNDPLGLGSFEGQ